MTQEKWQEIKDLIKEKFEILSSNIEEFPDRPGSVEIIEFNGPMGKMRLEWTDQPLLIDKKTYGSKRIGSDTKVEYIYSDTERVQKFKAFRWDSQSNSWIEIESERGVFSF